MNLEGTVALVTGAAHRLGRALALGLAEAGCDVLVHYHRSAEAAEDTVKDIQALGRESVAVSADLGEREAIDGLFEALDAWLGRLDVLVNSAASFDRRPFEEIGVAEWDAVHAINLRAPFLVSQRAAVRMRTPDRAGARGEKGAAGLIINMADQAGVTAWKGFAHHGVSKAGLLHLTRVTARELAPDVRVNSIVPGPILPPPGESPDSVAWHQRGLRVPLERVGDPRDVARTAVFLAENDYVTGATIFVDGGEHLLPGGRD